MADALEILTVQLERGTHAKQRPATGCVERRQLSPGTFTPYRKMYTCNEESFDWGGAGMTAIQAFFLGMMVAFTPGMAFVAFRLGIDLKKSNVEEL
jgi:hypothetical protein